MITSFVPYWEPCGGLGRSRRKCLLSGGKLCTIGTTRSPRNYLFVLRWIFFYCKVDPAEVVEEAEELLALR